MRVAITRIDPSLPLPSYATGGATGFDFYCRLDTGVLPGQIARIPANVIVAVPAGYTLLVALRSSTPLRRGLLIPHGVGIIDQDYRGPNDEIQIQVYNFSSAPVTVRRGDRIAQGLLLPAPHVTWEEVPPETNASRSGFGSTG